MKNSPYVPKRRNARRFPIRILQSPPSTRGNRFLCSTKATASASCSENALIESGLSSSVNLSRSELYDKGETRPPYSALSSLIRPAALSASGRYCTPVGRSPKIEGASIIVNCAKCIHLLGKKLKQVINSQLVLLPKVTYYKDLELQSRLFKMHLEICISWNGFRN